MRCDFVLTDALRLPTYLSKAETFKAFPTYKKLPTTEIYNCTTAAAGLLVYIKQV